MKSLEELCRTAAQAKYEVQKLCAEEKNRALEAVAEVLIANQETILKANEIDISNGQEKGMHSGLLDRLRLSTDRIKAMAQGRFRTLWGRFWSALSVQTVLGLRREECRLES